MTRVHAGSCGFYRNVVTTEGVEKSHLDRPSRLRAFQQVSKGKMRIRWSRWGRPITAQVVNGNLLITTRRGFIRRSQTFDLTSVSTSVLWHHDSVDNLLVIEMPSTSVLLYADEEGELRKLESHFPEVVARSSKESLSWLMPKNEKPPPDAIQLRLTMQFGSRVVRSTIASLGLFFVGLLVFEVIEFARGNRQTWGLIPILLVTVVCWTPWVSASKKLVQMGVYVSTDRIAVCNTFGGNWVVPASSIDRIDFGTMTPPRSVVASWVPTLVLLDGGQIRMEALMSGYASRPVPESLVDAVHTIEAITGSSVTIPGQPAAS